MGSYEDACKAVGRDKDNKANNNVCEFFVQHFNSSYCSLLFVLATMVVVAKEVFGEQIKCWCPATFTDTQVKYTNNYCYVRNTYYVPFGHTISHYPEDRQEREITYYPWVPIILLSQSVLFVVPKWAWMEFQSSSSCSFVSKLTKDQSSFNTEDQSKVAHIMNRWLRNRLLKTNRGMLLRRNMFSFEFSRESCLARANVFCCLLYALNSIGQIFVLDNILGNEFLTIGIDILFENNYEQHGLGMLRFPTVTLCDADIRRMTNVKTYTVQCSLPNNLFNEKIFLASWFLLVILSIVNLISLFSNLTIFIRRRRSVLIKRLLICSENPVNPSQDVGNDRELFDEFSDTYLGVDGVFVISMVGHQLGAVYTSVLVENLWNIFYDHKNNDEKIN
ncbi:innexin unc-9-like [Mizuhopecten yessoensis]|uniref:Innexin n=1 Tax=Mizuhopecten yessoensis TaxID=6573 RepID=A0A210Q0V7_MIZYE|nr:innexin unc-9-like [Mizuhopecten yessoensis]OWF42366.1 Innexin unc-7 [Mizuhopecten yessoensis]